MNLLDYHRLHREETEAWNLSALEQAARAQDATLPDQLTQLLPSLEERFSSGLVTIDRGPLFEKLESLAKLYLRATPEQQTYIRSRLNWKAAEKLESFGIRAAALGVREQSRELVRIGLAAFAAGDIGPDAREILMSVALLFHCANRCGSDAQSLFQEAAAISGPGMAALLLDFLNRPPGLQTLACMGWQEVETPEGPGYRWGWPKGRTPAHPKDAQSG